MEGVYRQVSGTVPGGDRTMPELPPEAEKLLAATPEEFVAGRDRIARELRADGRDDEAKTVGALRKPSAVVLAVNRAARDRPQSARAAAKAAERVRQSQLSGQAERYRTALDELERAQDELAEVAVARLSRVKPASEAMRRRVGELLRAALADDAGREALVRGALDEELEASGFGPFAGLSVPQSQGGSARTSSARTRTDERKRTREKELRRELAEATDSLREAERNLAEAVRERERAERAVASIQAKLDRL